MRFGTTAVATLSALTGLAMTAAAQDPIEFTRTADRVRIVSLRYDFLHPIDASMSRTGANGLRVSDQEVDKPAGLSITLNPRNLGFPTLDFDINFDGTILIEGGVRFIRWNVRDDFPARRVNAFGNRITHGRGSVDTAVSAIAGAAEQEISDGWRTFGARIALRPRTDAEGNANRVRFYGGPGDAFYATLLVNELNAELGHTVREAVRLNRVTVNPSALRMTSGAAGRASGRVTLNHAVRSGSAAYVVDLAISERRFTLTAPGASGAPLRLSIPAGSDHADFTVSVPADTAASSTITATGVADDATATAIFRSIVSNPSRVPEYAAYKKSPLPVDPLWDPTPDQLHTARSADLQKAAAPPIAGGAKIVPGAAAYKATVPSVKNPAPGPAQGLKAAPAQAPIPGKM